MSESISICVESEDRIRYNTPMNRKSALDAIRLEDKISSINTLLHTEDNENLIIKTRCLSDTEVPMGILRESLIGYRDSISDILDQMHWRII
jgi:hypothetical protein